MVSPKKIVKYAFMVLLVLYIFRSCSYAADYTSVVPFIGERSDIVDEILNNFHGTIPYDEPTFYSIYSDAVTGISSSQDFVIYIRQRNTSDTGSIFNFCYGTIDSTYDHIPPQVGGVKISGYKIYYSRKFNLVNENWTSLSISNLQATDSSLTYYLVYYNNIYYEWSKYGFSISSMTPSVKFLPNGDELSYYTNGFKVNNLTVYYDFNQWVNLGTIENGGGFTFVGSLSRISNPATDYHLYESFTYPDTLYITDNVYVDINSYNLYSGQFYSLVLGVYKNNEYVTEFNVFYYINGGPSSGDWLVVRSGDIDKGPSSQTNTKNIIDTINDGFTSLFTIDSGDVDEIYNNALTYFPSGDSPVALYDIIFGSLDGNSSGDFIISWDNFNLIATISGGDIFYSGDFIAGNSINFSKFCRENEQFSLLKGYINSFTQFFFILTFLLVFYKCIIVMLGLNSDFINEELTPGSDDYKRHEIGFIQGGRK